MNAKVIIGANFGDEGKGIITARIAKEMDADINIRFSSGCGATHTVEKRDGFRHVFGHIGSAMSVNVPTYLSKYFVVCPTLFKKEYEELSKKMTVGRIYVDPQCRVTTIWDVILNQLKEIERDYKRHGSTGVGTHETIVRCEDEEYRLQVRNLANVTFSDLKDIREGYFAPKIEALAIKKFPAELIRVMKDDDIINKMIDDFRFFEKNTTLRSGSFLRHYNNLIFEGSQGLLLDQDHKWFPYVTHSKTGVPNVINILKEADIDADLHVDFEINYVTRTYMTRHGAGPFPSEDEKMNQYFDIADKTNVPNDFQGTIRFGYLHVPLLMRSIENDFEDCTIPHKTKIHVTCMDHCKDPMWFNYFTNDFPIIFKDIGDVNYWDSPYID